MNSGTTSTLTLSSGFLELLATLSNALWNVKDSATLNDVDSLINMYSLKQPKLI